MGLENVQFEHILPWCQYCKLNLGSMQKPKHDASLLVDKNLQQGRRAEGQKQCNSVSLKVQEPNITRCLSTSCAILTRVDGDNNESIV